MTTKLIADSVLDRIRKDIDFDVHNKKPCILEGGRASTICRPKIDPKNDLPDTLSEWPPVARYIVKELERLADLPRDRAELVVRVAWHNATVCGENIERLGA